MNLKSKIYDSIVYLRDEEHLHKISVDDVVFKVCGYGSNYPAEVINAIWGMITKERSIEYDYYKGLKVYTYSYDQEIGEDY